MTNVGTIIRTLRQQKHMSVDELARRIGKSRATVYRYENGSIEEMPYTVLVPIANALNVSPADLLGIDDDYNRSRIDELSEYISSNCFADYEIEELIDYAKWIVNKRSR